MEVYIEMVYVLLFVTCIISLESMSILLNTMIDTKEMVVKSTFLSLAVSGIYVDYYLLFLYWFLLFIWWYQKQVFLYFPTFLIVYLSLILFFHSMIKGSFVFQGIILIASQSNLLSYSIVIFVLATVEILFLVYSKKKIVDQQYCYDFEFWWQGNKVAGIAFLDSGNNLYYQGFPLLLIHSKYLLGYQAIDTLITRGISKRVINIIKIEQIVINNQTLKNIYAGVVEEMEYDILLNKQLMGGVL